jgi:outer membrane receptor protein involved in Fe transport
MRRERFRTLLFLSLFLILLGGRIVIAQEVTGSINGVVRDQSGAVIAGATVTAANQQRRFTATADQDGSYSFTSLPPDAYKISAAAPGFGTTELDNVVVELGRTLRVNMELQVGAMNEVVNIDSSREPIVDVSSSKTSVNITERQIAVLPKSLDFSSVIRVAPGTRGETKAGGFQIDGASGAENVFIVDGVEVTDLVTGTLGSTKSIPLDFVKEVQVKSAGYEAEFGGATGGVINVVTRGGTNDYHGEFRMEYTSDTFRGSNNFGLRLNRLDPTQRTAEYFRIPKFPSQFLNPTFTLGGPIVKEKLWFFTSYTPQFNRVDSVINLIKPIARGDTEIKRLDTRSVESKTRLDFLITRLDWAPSSKVSVFAIFTNSPIRTEGPASLPFETTSLFTFSNPRYEFQGGYIPSSQVSFGVNWQITPRLILSFRGGHNYLNAKFGNYDIPVNTPLVIISTPCTRPECAPGTTAAGRPTIQTNFLTEIDQTRRTNLNVDATYITTIFGQQHVFKGGYQTNLLSSRIEDGFSGGVFQFFFDRSFTGKRGNFGYYTVGDQGTTGDIDSSNQGFFFQDAWQVHRRVTLNLGVRFEKEFLPSFPVRTDFHPTIPPDVAANVPRRAIDFGFGEKVAPRIGGAWDVFGNGKLKLSGSFSLFYDTMKYDLPRLSFGGGKILFTVRKLEQPDFRGITLQNQPGEIIFGPIDAALPANVTLPGERPNIDPDLKPFRLREYSAAAEYSLRNDLVVSARFTRKEVDRAIEDVGGTDKDGNISYTIGNPGFGFTRRFFNPPTPKAVREYTGLELRLDKRFSKNWYANISYIYSKLFGNYSGLASSDENGRTSPNITILFDLPELIFDTFGKPLYGRLATDRPNTFRTFAAYTFNYKLGGKSMVTEVGGAQTIFQGIPITTSLNARVGESGVNIGVFPSGRGDLGRTPVFTNTDLVVNHIINISDRVKIKFSLNVFNLFDERNAGDLFANLVAPGQFVAYKDLNDYLNSKGDFMQRIEKQKLLVDPRYKLPTTFQGPRNVRFNFGIQF